MALLSDFRRQIQPWDPTQGDNPVVTGLAAFKATREEGRQDVEEKLRAREAERRDAELDLRRRAQDLDEALFPLKQKQAENTLAMFGLDVTMKEAQINNQRLQTNAMQGQIRASERARDVLSGILSDTPITAGSSSAPANDFELGPYSAQPNIGFVPDPLPEGITPIEGDSEFLDALPNDTNDPLPAPAEQNNPLSSDAGTSNELTDLVASRSDFSATGLDNIPLTPIGTQAIAPTATQMSISLDNPLDNLVREKQALAKAEEAALLKVGSHEVQTLPPAEQAMVVEGIKNSFAARQAAIAVKEDALSGALFFEMPEGYQNETRQFMQFGMEPTKAVREVTRLKESDEFIQQLNAEGRKEAFENFARGSDMEPYIYNKETGRSVINPEAYRTFQGAGAKRAAAVEAKGKELTDVERVIDQNGKLLGRVAGEDGLFNDAATLAPRIKEQAEKELFKALRERDLIRNEVPPQERPRILFRDQLQEGLRKFDEVSNMPKTKDRDIGVEAAAIAAEYNLPVVDIPEGATDPTQEQVINAFRNAFTSETGRAATKEDAESLIGSGYVVRQPGNKAVVRQLSRAEQKETPTGATTLADEMGAPSDTSSEGLSGFEAAAARRDAEAAEREAARAKRDAAKAEQDAIKKVEQERQSLESQAAQLRASLAAIERLESSEGAAIPNSTSKLDLTKPSSVKAWAQADPAFAPVAGGLDTETFKAIRGSGRAKDIAARKQEAAKELAEVEAKLSNLSS